MNNSSSENRSVTSEDINVNKSVIDVQEKFHQQPVANKKNETYRMVALDLDGTLLQSNREISTEQADYLKCLQERGFIVCIATGRAATGVYQHVKKLGIDNIPVVCSNGARGFHCSSTTLETKELFYNPVPKSVVLQTIERCNALGYAIQYYNQDDIYANAKTPEHRNLTSLYMQYTGVTIQHIEDDFQSLLEQDQLPSKLLVLYEPHHSKVARDTFSKELKDKATVVKGYCEWFLEILSPTVTKGHGLQNMCTELGISLEECIAIGDGCNDIEFLKMSGMGICMKNGEDEVKEIADTVLDWTNDQDGIMKVLQDFDTKGQLKFD